ncbi:MAG: TetR-like C-terminal domain-containing protein, partial [Pseudomonadota bacterium]
SPEAQRAANEAFDVLVRHVAALLPLDASPGSKQRAALRIWATLHGYVSLRHHVIGQLMDYQQWRNMTLDSFEKVVKDLKETAALSGLV